MTRTASRPLATGELDPGTVLLFGLLTTAAALLLFQLLGGWLASGLAAAVFVAYLLVYTAWLKPRSPLNTVIGGTAGAAAPLLADASLHGELSPFAWLLFAVVFLWTPPHTWAIAIFRRDEYAAAGIPMLPNVAGNRRARRDGLLYFAAMVPATCAPAALPGIGWAVVPIALALDAWLLAAYLRAVAADDPAVDRRAFLVSVRMMGLLVLCYTAAAASPFPAL